MFHDLLDISDHVSLLQEYELKASNPTI
jgi:hypothetical protein